MWRCKECGSTEIIGEVTEEIVRIGKPNKNYAVEIEEFSGVAPRYSKTIIFECENCVNCSKNIEDIAEWVEE